MKKTLIILLLLIGVLFQTQLFSYSGELIGDTKCSEINSVTRYQNLSPSIITKIDLIGDKINNKYIKKDNSYKEKIYNLYIKVLNQYLNKTKYSGAQKEVLLKIGDYFVCKKELLINKENLEIFDIKITDITDHSAKVTWEGNSKVKTWVYVKQNSNTGKKNNGINNVYEYTNLSSGYEFILFVQGVGSNNIKQIEFKTLEKNINIGKIVTQIKKNKYLEEDAKLYFKSDFDGNVHILKTVSDTVRPNIIGKDLRGNTFPNSLPGVTQDASGYGVESNLFNQFRTNVYAKCQDDFNKYVVIDIRDVIGPKGNIVSALYQELKASAPVRSCYQPTGLTSAWYIKPDRKLWKTGNQLVDNKKSLKTSYQRFWTRHTFTNTTDWRLLTQTKSYDKNDTVRYKWSFYIAGMGKTTPYWQLSFEHEYKGDQVNIINKDIPVPINEWFKYETFIIHSEGDDGYLGFAVNNQVVMEYHGPTMDNSIAKTGLLYPGTVRLTGPYGCAGTQISTGLEIWDKPPSTSVFKK